jgi:hypothetical protein
LPNAFVGGSPKIEALAPLGAALPRASVMSLDFASVWTLAVDWMAHGLWQLSWWQQLLYALATTHITIAALVNPLENYKRQRRAFRSSRLRLGHCTNLSLG